MSLTQKSIIKALNASFGNISKAAKKLDVSRQYLSTKVNGSEKLKQAKEEAREELVDIAEETIFDEIEKMKDIGLAKWVVSTLGKTRGFTERTEVTGEDGGAIEITLKRKVVGGKG